MDIQQEVERNKLSRKTFRKDKRLFSLLQENSENVLLNVCDVDRPGGGHGPTEHAEEDGAASDELILVGAHCCRTLAHQERDVTLPTQAKLNYY